MTFFRFEKENGGGNIYTDASEMTRDEIKFHNFIRRIRTIFREIVIKPLKVQMMRDFPELIEDHNFIKSLNVKFVSNELFEEWKYLGNLEKRANIASTLISNLQNSEGEPYLAMEWIVREIMKFDDEDIAKNQKYKIKEKGELTSTEGEGSGEDIMTGPGADFFKQGGETGEKAQEFGGEEFSGESPQEPGEQVQSDEEFGGEEFGGEEPETPPQSQ